MVTCDGCDRRPFVSIGRIANGHGDLNQCVVVIAYLDDVGIATDLCVEVVTVAAVRVRSTACTDSIVVHASRVDVGSHVVRVVGTVWRVAGAVNVLAACLCVVQVVGNPLRTTAIGVATRLTSIHEGALPHHVRTVQVGRAVNDKDGLHSTRVAAAVHHGAKVLGVCDREDRVDVPRLCWAGDVVLPVNHRPNFCAVSICVVTAS